MEVIDADVKLLRRRMGKCKAIADQIERTDNPYMKRALSLQLEEEQRVVEQSRAVLNRVRKRAIEHSGR
jgi:hypothetical protein